MNLKSLNTNGYILFTAVALTLCGTLLIFGFISTFPTEELRINYKIAKTKALYNAETGIAQKAYPFLIKSDFTTDTTLIGETITYQNIDMGLYLDPELSFSDSGERLAEVEGVSFILTAEGRLDSVKEKVAISDRPETLAKYMYLTNS